MNVEYPRGYKEAYEKYVQPQDNTRGLWVYVKFMDNCRKELRQFDSGEEPLKNYVELPKSLARDRALPEYQEFIENIRRASAEWDSRVIEALHANDADFLQKLVDALQSPELPQMEWDGVKAALIAFKMLFDQKKLRSRENWPTKKQIRLMAERLLEFKISDRHWPRIFKEAGLWELRPDRLHDHY